MPTIIFMLIEHDVFFSIVKKAICYFYFIVDLAAVQMMLCLVFCRLKFVANYVYFNVCLTFKRILKLLHYGCVLSKFLEMAAVAFRHALNPPQPSVTSWLQRWNPVAGRMPYMQTTKGLWVIHTNQGSDWQLVLCFFHGVLGSAQLYPRAFKVQQTRKNSSLSYKTYFLRHMEISVFEIKFKAF